LTNTFPIPKNSPDTLFWSRGASEQQTKKETGAKQWSTASEKLIDFDLERKGKLRVVGGDEYYLIIFP